MNKSNLNIARRKRCNIIINDKSYSFDEQTHNLIESVLKDSNNKKSTIDFLKQQIKDLKIIINNL